MEHLASGESPLDTHCQFKPSFIPLRLNRALVVLLIDFNVLTWRFY